MMRTILLLAVVVPWVSSAPHPQDDPTAGIPRPTESMPTATLPLPLSTSLNVPVTSVFATPTGLFPINVTSTSKTRMVHSEPIPIFSKKCDCPDLATMAYPCWATDALQKCNFEENHSMICWTSANFGCPSPTKNCEALFTPTPLSSGRHPCEMGPPEPTKFVARRLKQAK